MGTGSFEIHVDVVAGTVGVAVEASEGGFLGDEEVLKERWLDNRGYRARGCAVRHGRGTSRVPQVRSAFNIGNQHVTATARKVTSPSMSSPKLADDNSDMNDEVSGVAGCTKCA